MFTNLVHLEYNAQISQTRYNRKHIGMFECAYQIRSKLLLRRKNLAASLLDLMPSMILMEILHSFYIITLVIMFFDQSKIVFM